MSRMLAILEAPGEKMYSGVSRISIFTGMPSLVGWGYQVGQQSGRGTQVNERYRSAGIIYNSDSSSVALAELKKYNVNFIYVGTIEKKLYPRNLGKFIEIAEPVYKNEEATLYKLKENP